MGARLRLLLIHSKHVYMIVRRALVVARYVMRKPHEQDFAAFSLFPDRTGHFLDVGANAGQSALSFRLFNRHAPILSLEPNPYHEKDLRFLKKILPRFDFMICGAGDENASLTLFVPSYRGVPLTGEASLVREEAENSYWLREHLNSESSPELGIIELTVQVRRLDEFNLAPSFVKIDVEGFELSVLRGLSETLKEHRPILLIEKSKQFERVRDFLADLEYTPLAFKVQSNRFDPHGIEHAGNVFFLPKEAVQSSLSRSGETGQRSAWDRAALT